MNVRKLDTALISALRDLDDQEEASLVVFIQTERSLNPEQRMYLAELGIPIGGINRRLFTGTLSSSKISELSDKPWVIRIRLSKKLRYVEACQGSHCLRFLGAVN